MLSAGAGLAICLGGSAFVGVAGAWIAHNFAKLFLMAGKFRDEKITVQDLKKADHIYRPGNNSNGVKLATGSGLYYHHGVYIGDGKVADFGAVNKTKPVIRPLKDFLGENGASQLYRRVYTEQCVSPDETVKHAIELASESATWEPYDLVKNNCEHFATVLKVKLHWSGQANIVPQEPFYGQVIQPSKNKW